MKELSMKRVLSGSTSSEALKIAPTTSYQITTLQEAVQAYEKSGIPHRQTLLDAVCALKRWPELKQAEPNGRALKAQAARAHVKREKNLLSSLRRLIKEMRAIHPGEVGPLQLSPNWASVCERFKQHHLRIPLGQFGRYCQRRGISPQEVCTPTVIGFQEHLEECASAESPRRVARRVMNAWNKGVDGEPNWPGTNRIELPDYKPIATPTMEELGPRLAAEIEACFGAIDSNCSRSLERTKLVRRDKNAPKNKTGLKVSLKPSTLKSYKDDIRLALRLYSQISGTPLIRINFEDLVDPEIALSILDKYDSDLAARGKGTRASESMAYAILCVAQRHFAVSEEDAEDIRDYAKQLKSDREPTISSKNIERLRAISNNRRQDILRLPSVLLSPVVRKAKANEHLTQNDLCAARVAVAIAIETIAPVRVSNLAETRIGKHLIISNDRFTEARLCFDGSTVKNSLKLDYVIPVDVAELIKEYIRHVLPRMYDDPKSDALFPGKFGCSTIGGYVLGVRISRYFREHLQLEFNTHLFRHCTAINYLEHYPGEYEVVRLLLGNKNLETVKNFYTGLEKEAAIRKTISVVAEQKRVAGLSPTNMLNLQYNRSSNRLSNKRMA